MRFRRGSGLVNRSWPIAADPDHHAVRAAPRHLGPDEGGNAFDFHLRVKIQPTLRQFLSGFLIHRIASLQSRLCLPGLPGLALETGSLFVPAVIYLLAAELRGVGSFGHVAPQTNLLIALSGIITAVPLLLFAEGARRVPLSTLGLLQYTTPTLQFLIGVFLYNEPFTSHQLIGFSVIWLALILFSTESLITTRRVGANAPAD